MSFGDVVWTIIISFAFVAYLMLFFSILTDLFRDRELNGFAKAIWVIVLILVPFLSAFIYVIARGNGMAERGARQAAVAQKQTEAYIRDVAAKDTVSPADQIAQAKQMLDTGAITEPEFDRLKEKALA